MRASARPSDGRRARERMVGQRARVGADSQVHRVLAGQLADQEGDPAQIPAEHAFVRTVVEFGDASGDLVEQHARVDQVGRQGTEEIACGNDRPQAPVGDPLQGIVKDAQLRTKLAVRACDRSEAGLPEPAAGLEQGVVGLVNARVLARDAELGALQLARHFAGVFLEHALDRRGGAGLLAQQHFAGDLLDFGVGELDRDSEAVPEPLERRVPIERRLARRHEQQPAGKLGLDGLGDLGDGCGTVAGVADVLLHFVQDEDRERDSAAGVRERLLGRVHKLGRPDVARGAWKLCAQQLPGRLRVRGEVGTRLGHGVRQDRAHVEVGEFAPPVLASVLDGAPHLVQQPLVPQPKAEPGLCVVLGQSTGS